MSFLAEEIMLTQFTTFAEHFQNSLSQGPGTTKIGKQIRKLRIKGEKWPGKIMTCYKNRSLLVPITSVCSVLCTELIQLITPCFEYPVPVRRTRIEFKKFRYQPDFTGIHRNLKSGAKLL